MKRLLVLGLIVCLGLVTIVAVNVAQQAQQGGAAAGGAEPLVGEEGPVVGAAEAGAGGRGGVRPHGERCAVPAYGPVPQMAAGPGAGELHLRPAGGAGEL